MTEVLQSSVLLLMWLLIILEEVPSTDAYITMGLPLAAVILKPAILGTLGLMGAAGVGLVIKKKLEKNDYSIGLTIDTEGGKSKHYGYDNGGDDYGNNGYDYGGSSYGGYDNSYGGYDNSYGGNVGGYGGGNEIYGNGGYGGGYGGGHGGGYGGGHGGGYGGGHGGGYGGGHGGGYGGGNGGGYGNGNGGGNGGGYGSSKGNQNFGKGNKGKGSKEVIFYFRKNKSKGDHSHYNPDYGYAMPYQSHGYGNQGYGNNGYGHMMISPAGPLNPKEHGVFNGDTPPGAAEFPGVFGPSPLEEVSPLEPSPSSENSFDPLTHSVSSSSMPDTLSPTFFPNSFSPSSSFPSPLPVLPLEDGEPSPRFPPETDIIFDPQPKSSSKGKTLKEMMADFFPSRKKRDTQGGFSSAEDTLSVEFLLMQALKDDVKNCAKMMLCGLGATPLQFLSEEEKATVQTVRSVNDAYFALKLPLYQGMRFKNLNACQLFYIECPTLLQDLLRSMRKEIARTKLIVKR